MDESINIRKRNIGHTNHLHGEHVLREGYSSQDNQINVTAGIKDCETIRNTVQPDVNKLSVNLGHETESRQSVEHSSSSEGDHSPVSKDRRVIRRGKAQLHGRSASEYKSKDRIRVSYVY